MLFVFFCINPRGEYLHLTYQGSFESGCAALTYMVTTSWQMLRVELIDEDQTRICLPVEAFQGGSWGKPLGQLQQEWHKILS